MGCHPRHPLAQAPRTTRGYRARRLPDHDFPSSRTSYVALAIPAKFIPQIDPHYTEVSLLLATQVKDEARHIEVYTKRALANGGGLQYVSSTTQWALKSLTAQNNYLKSSFLLHTLGEGTFLELLKFIEDIAPDPVTREILMRTRQGRGPPRGIRRGPCPPAPERRPLHGRCASGSRRGALFLSSGHLRHQPFRPARPRHPRRWRQPARSSSKLALSVCATSTAASTRPRVNRLMVAGLPEPTARRISELHGVGGQAYM